MNLGTGKPGRFPGEAAITKEVYVRWLEGISAMNVNVVRTYTLHPPGFYEALAEHNAGREEPLMVLHGNWIAEPALVESGDAFDDRVVEIHWKGIEEVVDAVHGELSAPERTGHADGTYRADVSPYVLGYVLGVEWPPEVVAATDEANEGIGDYDGEYVRTEGATPFERWLAERLDGTAAYEDDRYGDRRPLSFTNWPTIDHLEHPAEPQDDEDAINVRDPSRHEVVADLWDDGIEGRSIEGISVAAVTFAPDDLGPATELSVVDDDGGVTITDAIGALSEDRLAFGPQSTFAWDGWEEPSYHERRKESYDLIQAAFADAGR